MKLARLCGLLLLAWSVSACAAAAVPLIPTDLPTQTLTFTPSPTRTPALNETPTARPTLPPPTGASPTPLLGAPRTPQGVAGGFITPTRVFNPNAPRIEFFTSDPLRVEPGKTVTLFWSARGVDNAVIYRLDAEGNRTQVYNVPPDGSLPITTRNSERGELRFVLSIGTGDNYSELTHSIPLTCPLTWFFNPPPNECPKARAEETRLIDQTFERGRMVFAEGRNVIFVLFNDGRKPAWLTFENRYNPDIHAERDPNAPPEFIQPLRELGYLWRTNDTVRTRLGLGLAEAVAFDGLIQAAPARNQAETLYISGADGKILNLLAGGEVWLVISASR